MQEVPEVSVVIPLYNEEETVSLLYTRLKSVLKSSFSSHEIIFVNDGSKDKTLEILKQLHASDPKVKIIAFSRNFGHQQAISGGLAFAHGKVVAVMDGDLQDPPEELPKMYQKLKEGYEVVYGIRCNRKESMIKQSFYKIFYRLLNCFSRIDIPLDSGDFCVMTKKVVKMINSYFPERNRFLRGLRAYTGFKQIGHRYDRQKRIRGKSKYSFRSLIKLALDGIISFSSTPLKIVMVVGLSISVLSFAFTAFVVLAWSLDLRPMFINIQEPGWTSLVVLISFLGGVTLVSIGIVGEYLARIFDEVKMRPPHIIDEIINFESEDRVKKRCKRCGYIMDESFLEDP